MKNCLLKVSLRIALFSCCIFILNFFVKVQAQDISMSWAFGYGGSTVFPDQGRGIMSDKEGNVTTVGCYRGTADFDPGTGNNMITSVGFPNTFIQKVDTDGQLLWAKVFIADTTYSPGSIQPGSYGLGNQPACMDDFGNTYVTGQFNKRINFDPDSTNTTLTSTMNAAGTVNNINSFIAKINADGSLGWLRQVGGTANAYGDAIYYDGKGNIYTIGHFYNMINTNIGGNGDTLMAATGKNTYIIKYDTAGNHIWAKVFIGQSMGLSTDHNANVYVSGVYSGNVNYGDNPADTLGTGTGPNLYVAKLDSSGALVWIKSFLGGALPTFLGETGGSVPGNVKADDDGNVYFSGYIMSTVDFDPGPDDHILGPYNTFGFAPAPDAYIAKLDADGNFVWVKRFGKENTGSITNYSQIFDMHIDDRGHIYATGGFGGTIDFNPDSTATEEISANGIDMFILKMDTSGVYHWTQKIGGANDEWPYSLHVENTGNFYLTGNFYGTAAKPSNFAIEPDNFSITSNGTSGPDIFTAKYFECIHFSANHPGSIIGPDSVCLGGTYTYTAHIPSAATYTWTLPDGWIGNSTGHTIEVQVNTDGGTVSVVGNGLCDTSEVFSKTIELSIPKVFITVNGYELSTSNTAYDSWQWYLDGAPINGADDTKYIVTQNGVYSVVVSGADNCTDSTSYTVNNYDVSVNDIKGLANHISIFPNPTNDLLYIKSPVAVSLSLSNVTGKVIRFAETGSQLSLKDLEDGIYFLHLADKEGRLIKVDKVIKIY